MCQWSYVYILCLVQVKEALDSSCSKVIYINKKISSFCITNPKGQIWGSKLNIFLVVWFKLNKLKGEWSGNVI